MIDPIEMLISETNSEASNFDLSDGESFKVYLDFDTIKAVYRNKAKNGVIFVLGLHKSTLCSDAEQFADEHLFLDLIKEKAKSLCTVIAKGRLQSQGEQQ